ncbi:MAG: TetR/AcrR family transcriptional regulator [Actinomycetota bacterium]
MTSGVPQAGSTQHRILSEASKLFATRGFLGTSTRDIADAVGIRQPSLFHHFSSKHSILVALLDLDLDRVTTRLQLLHRAGESAPVRLHCHLALDVQHILEFPFDVRGLYVRNEQVPEGSEFSVQRRKLASIHRQVRQMVQDSISGGDFIEIDPEFVRQLISSAIIGVMWTRGPTPSKGLSTRIHELPDFLLRSLLTKSRQLDSISRRSRSLQDEIRQSLASPLE